MSHDDLGRRILEPPLRLISKRIREARAEAQLTLDELAVKVGSSRHHLIRLEKGHHRPRARMLEAIAQATGKPIDWFLVEEAGNPAPFRDAA